MSSEEGGSHEGSGSGSPPPRHTTGKGRSRDAGGSRNADEYEDMAASDEAADEAQQQLEDVEEEVDELLDELDNLQAGGPQAIGSESQSETTGTAGAAEGSDGGTGSESGRVSMDTGGSDRSPPVGSWGKQPSTAEFARTVLTHDAVKRKHLEGDGEVNVTDPNEPDHEKRIGGFNSFSRNNIGEWESIKGKEDEERGFTDHAIDVAKRQEGAEGDFDRVYRTKYGKGDDRVSDSDLSSTTADDLKTNQIATSTFTAILGAETPRMTYDPERNEVVAEGVGEGSSKTVKEMYQVQRRRKDTQDLAGVGPDEDTIEDMERRANNVDRQEFIDKAAIQGLAGNWDQSSDNIMIDDDGSVLTYDYDRSFREFGDYKTLEQTVDRASTTAEKIDDIRADDNQLNISSEEIADRAAEIAYELERSGLDDVAVDAVRDHMNAMENDGVTDPVECDKHILLRRQIETAADAARYRFDWV